MRWQTIETQVQLDTLAALVRWEDSRVVKAHEGPRLDAELLVRTAGSPLPYLHLRLVGCDPAAGGLAERLSLRGKVDASRAVEILGRDGTPLLRVSELRFRWLAELPPVGAADWPW